LNHYLLFYRTTEGYVEKRQPYRDTHLQLARRAGERGELLLAGAYAEPADGALLIFRGEGPEVAEDFARNDPYVLNGLVEKWWVREWAVVVGG
jgi:uncharacterized protein YciI